MPYPVYFTLDEARSILPAIEENLRKLRKLHSALEFLSNIEIENNDGDPELDLLITRLNMEYYKKLYLYHKYLSKLLTKGAVIKDIPRGMIDFYSKHEERDIFLCWQIGEKDIMYWHELETSNTRQPIKLLEQTRNI